MDTVMRLRRYLWLILLLLLVLPSQAQETPSNNDRRGMVILPYSFNPAGDFDPLGCALGACPDSVYHLSELLFPRLLAIDPQTHTYTAGTYENNGLAESWTYSDDLRTVTFNLRDDATWTDGTPITAYDAMFSLQATRLRFFPEVDGPFVGMRVLDDHTLEITTLEADCNTINLMNEFIAPAHVYRPGYREAVDDFFDADAPLAEQWQDWLVTRWGRSISPPGIVRDYIIEEKPIVTGGRYRVFEYDADAAVMKLEPRADGPLIELRNGFPFTARDFREGDFTFIYDVHPVEKGPLEVAGAQFSTVPENESVALWFNMANARNPQPAFDPETGERIEQEPNMYFSDRNMRLAIAHLIDMDTIINDVFGGDAAAIASIYPPTSWLANDDLERIPYNFEEGNRLLHEAGWQFVRGSWPRQCIDCGTAQEGTFLQMFIAVQNNSNETTSSVVQRIADQLSRAGVEVFYISNDPADLEFQSFDIAVIQTPNSYPTTSYDPRRFTPEEDKPRGLNFTSYYNETLTDLLVEAQAVPQCDIEERQALYAEAQEILHDEIIAFGLYTPHQVIAAKPALQNFNPATEQLFWQVTEWDVWND